MNAMEPPSITAPDPSKTSPDTGHLNTWIELSRSAYAANMAFLRRCVGPGVELSAVVKSNAYGHGLSQVAGLARDHGADSFCVHSLDEALELRAAGFAQDVLIMGHVPLGRLGEAVAEDFRLVFYHRETVEELARLAADSDRPVRLHLKVETGTHRQGVEGEELAELLDALKDRPGLILEGVYTHFADIEDTTDHTYARSQLGRFQKALETIRDAGFEPTKRHTACSAATVLFPETHYDLVRVGISQYGFWSSKETRLSHDLRSSRDTSAGDLEPVMTWKTRVSQVKTVEAGAAVGYGCSFITTRRSRIAVLPTGYSDGYDRHLSSSAHVLVRGHRAPVVGRICMNLTLIDVTDVPDVRLEDEVVLLGGRGENAISADYLAELVGTIHYEIVTRLRPGIPRFVVS